MSEKTNILERVRAALHSAPRLGAAFNPSRLDIDEEGTLTIEGEVPSVAAKKLGLERVAALPEVSAIIDRLRVAPASRMGDAEIRAHLREAFQQDPNFAALKIAERRGVHTETVRGVPNGAVWGCFSSMWTTAWSRSTARSRALRPSGWPGCWPGGSPEVGT